MGGGIRRFLNIFYPKNQFSYFRSALFLHLTYKIVKKSVIRYSDADLCIFTCYDFYNKYNNIPSLLFGDWTYKIKIIDRLKRNPYFFEIKFAQWEKESIENADYVVTLFPECFNKMIEDYPTANIHYLGGNVVNSLYGKKHDVDTFINIKERSNSILFIGGKHYIKGAQFLVDAIQLLKEKDKNIKLDIIGMKNSDFSHLPENVYCHGYLRKDIKEERNLYYKLVIEAKALVNPTKVWAGYSSSIEAMYFATPVIVSHYDDFVKEFGEEINFGIYCLGDDAVGLAKDIYSIISSPQYSTMCRNAYERVKGYTWDSYIDRMFKMIQES